MQVSLGPQEGLKRQVTVTVPVERIQEAFDKKFKHAKNTVKIDGFRPGKTPTQVIESRFGESIYQEVVSEIIRDTLFSALQQEDLSPVGMPTITELKADRGAPVEYVAKFEVFPEITLKDLTGESVEKVTSEVTDADIDEILARLRQQRTTWVDVDRAAQTDDQVTIDFEGQMDGELFPGGAGQQMPLVLGSGRMIPGFEEGIIGMQTGEEKSIDVTFPATYHEASLAGKAVQFKITLHKVCAPELPPLDDKLAEAFGIKAGGLEALKQDMRKHMEIELENGLKMLNKMTVLDKLVTVNPIDVPEAAVEHEMNAMHEQAQQQAGEKEKTPLTEDARRYLHPHALRRVKLGLLVAEYVKKHELKADQEKVMAIVEKMAASYDTPQEFIQWFLADKARAQQIEAVVVEDQVAEQLMAEANVTEKAMRYDDVMKAQQGGQAG